MKNILFFMVIYFLAINLKSDDNSGCGSNNITNCPNKAYPYIMCDGLTGKVRGCCKTDPNDYDPSCSYLNVNYSIPRKINFPICLVFDDSGPDLQYGYVCGGVDLTKTTLCHADIVYRKSDMQNELNLAAQKWNCLCGVESTTCLCTLHVKFVDYNVGGTFKDETLDYISNSLTMKNPPDDNQLDPNNKCQPNCSNITIYLNNTEKFRGGTYIPNVNGDLVNCTNNFYAIDSYLDNNLLMANQIHAYDIKDILIQEIGKIAGLGDPVDLQCDDVDPNSIMAGRQKEGSMSKNDMRKDMTTDDICMFKKLYCPQFTPVVEENQQGMKKLLDYPNPSSGIFNLTYQVNNQNENILIKIINCLGNPILDIALISNKSGQNNEIVNLSSLTSGIYYYEVFVGGNCKTVN